MDPVLGTVHPSPKKSTKILKYIMIILGILFLLGGILINRGMMLPCFLMAGLYFLFESAVEKEYEYCYEDDTLYVDEVHPRGKRSTVFESDLSGLVVLAPHDSPQVMPWRKDGSGPALVKYDFTSLQDQGNYWTMIVDLEDGRVKVLLDASAEMLQAIRYRHPDKVYDV